jgi:hypothetical protein
LDGLEGEKNGVGDDDIVNGNGDIGDVTRGGDDNVRATLAVNVAIVSSTDDGVVVVVSVVVDDDVDVVEVADADTIILTV